MLYDKEMIMSDSKYFIDSSYVHRTLPVENYLDDPEASSLYQVEVYEFAKTLYKGGLVLDIGCGVGDKLCSHFPATNTLGLDVEPTLSAVRLRHPDRAWALSDFSTPPTEHYSLVISADVIEHIFNPDEYLEFVQKIDFDLFLISTPDRDTLPYGNSGPPKNPSHYREWNFAEFHQYMSRQFNVREHRHCQEPDYLSQLMVLEKRV